MRLTLRIIAGLLGIAVAVFFAYRQIIIIVFGDFGTGNRMEGISAVLVWALWILAILGLAGFALFGPKKKER